MKKKRLIGFILVLAMLFTGSVGVLAVDDPIHISRDYEIIHKEDGSIFVESVIGGTVVVVAIPDTGMIDFAYAPTTPIPEDNIYTSYQLFVEDIPASEFDLDSLAFWDSVVDLAMSRMDTANVVQMRITSGPVSASTMSSQLPGEAEMEALLRERYGDEYTQTLDSTVYGGYDMEIVEALEHHVTEIETLNWGLRSTLSSIASWLATLCGYGIIDDVANFLSYLLFGADSVQGSITQNGALIRYQCQTKIFQRTYVENSTDFFSYVSKVYAYDGFVNALEREEEGRGLHGLYEDSFALYHDPNEYAFDNYNFLYGVALGSYQHYLETGEIILNLPGGPVIA